MRKKGGKIRHSRDRRRKRIIPTYGGSRFLRRYSPQCRPLSLHDRAIFIIPSPPPRIPSPPSARSIRSIGLNSRGGYTEIERGFTEHSADREITRATRCPSSWLNPRVSKMPRGLFTCVEGAGRYAERSTGTTVNSSLDPTKLELRKIINPVPQKWERIMDEREGLRREKTREKERGEGGGGGGREDWRNLARPSSRIIIFD